MGQEMSKEWGGGGGGNVLEGLVGSNQTCSPD